MALDGGGGYRILVSPGNAKNSFRMVVSFEIGLLWIHIIYNNDSHTLTYYGSVLECGIIILKLLESEADIFIQHILSRAGISNKTEGFSGHISKIV